MFNPIQAKVLAVLNILREIPKNDVYFIKGIGTEAHEVESSISQLELLGFIVLETDRLRLTLAGLRSMVGRLAGSGRRWWYIALHPSEDLKEWGFVGVNKYVMILPLNRLLEYEFLRYCKVLAIGTGRIGEIWIREYAYDLPFRLLESAKRAYQRASRYFKEGKSYTALSNLHKALEYANSSLKTIGLKEELNSSTVKLTLESFRTVREYIEQCRDRLLDYMKLIREKR